MALWFNAGTWLTAFAFSRCWIAAVSRPTVDNFGPGECIGVTRADHGTCKILTRCSDYNITRSAIAFVCYRAKESVRYALHSFDSSEFADEEDFDTGILCDDCMSVSVAFAEGGPIVRDALAAALRDGELPESMVPAEMRAEQKAKQLPRVAAAPFPEDVPVAYFGPNSCITTFKSPDGTCMLQTRCRGRNITGFNVGLTCLDRAGGYSRYMFGPGSFDARETFDTRIKCQACLGVDRDPAARQMRGVLPKQLVEDVNALKDEVKRLRTLLLGLRKGADLPDSTESSAPGPEPIIVPRPQPVVIRPQPDVTTPQPTVENVEPAVDDPVVPANPSLNITWEIRNNTADDGSAVVGSAKASPSPPPGRNRKVYEGKGGEGVNSVLSPASPPTTTAAAPAQITSTSIPAFVQSDVLTDGAAGLRGGHTSAPEAMAEGSIPDMPIIYHASAESTPGPSSLQELLATMMSH